MCQVLPFVCKAKEEVCKPEIHAGTNSWFNVYVTFEPSSHAHQSKIIMLYLTCELGGQFETTMVSY